MNRRLVIALASVPMVLMVAAGTASAGPGDAGVPDVYEVRAVAGGIHDSLAVPAYFETFAPYSLSEATNGSSHGYQSPFYAGFFLTAAAGQFGFPPPPGTTETLYPQGPTRASAGSSTVPDATAASSTSSSGLDGSAGESTGAAGTVGPGVTASGGQAATAVRAGGSVASAASSIVLHNLSLAGGLVKIGEVVGSASSRSSGRPGGASADGGIVLIDVTIAGQPASVNGGGASVLGAPLAAPPLPIVDQTLRQAGVTITRLPDQRLVRSDGTQAEMHIGGFQVVFSQPVQEFTATVTFGELDARTRAETLATAIPAPAAPAQAAPAPPAVVGLRVSRPPPAPTLAAAPARLPEVIRRVTQTAPARHGDWAAVAALAALAAPILVALRRLFRLAAAP